MTEREDLGTERILLGVFLLAAVIASLHALDRHHGNNFAIFRGAYHNLVAGRDLYAEYPALYADRFKYSPTFALLMAPLAVLPMSAGLVLWNVLNAAALWTALARLLPPRAAWTAMLIVVPELIGSMQSAQSNALVTALVIAAFLALDAGRPARAAAAIAAGTFIKIFPLAAGSLAFLRPRPVRTVAWLAAALVVFALLPLLVTAPATLAAQYASWAAIERADALAGVAAPEPWLTGGVMQQIRIWTGLPVANWPVQLIGTALLLAPLALRRARCAERGFRLRYLASLLIYMVIFNHQAESPTFVIAMTGVAIWFVAAPRGRAEVALLVAALVFVSVLTSSLVPHAIRASVVIPYGLKAIPCIAIWIVLQAELLRRAPSDPGEGDEAKGSERLAHAG